MQGRGISCLTSLVQCRSCLPGAAHSADKKSYDTLSEYSVRRARFRWDLRDTSHLLRLELKSYVDEFLALQPELPRLQYLRMGILDYTKKQAEQLQHLSTLQNLKVFSLPCSLGRTYIVHVFHVISRAFRCAAQLCTHDHTFIPISELLGQPPCMAASEPESRADLLRHSKQCPTTLYISIRKLRFAGTGPLFLSAGLSMGIRV